MEQKNLLTIELSRLDSEDINLFCKSNEITDVNGFVNLCLRKGYYIEKYGLLNQGILPDVIEREFEREVKVEDTSKIEELQNEINELKGKLENQKEIECGKLQESLIEMNKRIGEKNETIKDLRNRLQELENMTKSSYAFYLKNSNLTNKL
jgi:vacuolar-type H+-ATPase subunit I/STV1